MNIQEQYSLKNLNTFGVDATADFYTQVLSLDDFLELQETDIYKNNKRMVLGGGSNVLFQSDYHGLVIENVINGIQIIDETEAYVDVRVGAGEGWHDFVMHCVEHNWGGAENLALIPGTVGASPVQNIGAYGVEVRSTIQQVHVVNMQTGRVRIFNNDECDFGYRHSAFKTSLRGEYFITHVDFRLTKNPTDFHIEYGAIREVLAEQDLEPSVESIANAVIQIRTVKLPDPVDIPNAGSFFKNVFVSQSQLEKLQESYPDIPWYQEDNDMVKIPTAWLIDQCGWKGRRVGNAGVHDRQALVLVNHGGATGAEIVALSQQIQESVREKFNIDISPEVTII